MLFHINLSNQFWRFPGTAEVGQPIKRHFKLDVRGRQKGKGGMFEVVKPETNERLQRVSWCSLTGKDH